MSDHFDPVSLNLEAFDRRHAIQQVQRAPRAPRGFVQVGPALRVRVALRHSICSQAHFASLIH